MPIYYGGSGIVASLGLLSPCHERKEGPVGLDMCELAACARLSPLLCKALVGLSGATEEDVLGHFQLFLAKGW